MKSLLRDVNASLVVFLVALPLCLGIALASDAPPMSGLIAGVIGGLFVAFVGGSQVAVSGPAAGLTIVVANAILSLGSFELFCQSLFIAGIIQIGFAFLGFEKISRLIPSSVVKGLLSAIGILICYKELPHLFGLSVEQFYAREVHYLWRSEILMISIVALGSLFVWGRLQKKYAVTKNLPAPMVSILLASLATAYLGTWPQLSFTALDFVQLPQSFADFRLFYPTFEPSLNVLKVALSLALIASIETLLCLEASLSLDPLKRPLLRKKELIAQGAGNCLSGVLGGLPLTAVIVRTAANIDAGAETKRSSILHGLWILIFVVYFSGVSEKIPIAALAAVLISVGFKLFLPSLIKKKWDLGVLSFTTYVLTVVCIIFSDIAIGVLIGTIYFYVVKKIKPSWGPK
jgi:MFS superfamily sulfate permease-like transporter